MRIWCLSEVMVQYEEPQFIGYFLNKDSMEKYMKENGPKVWQYTCGDVHPSSIEPLFKLPELIEAKIKKCDEEAIEANKRIIELTSKGIPLPEEYVADFKLNVEIYNYNQRLVQELQSLMIESTK